VLELIMQNISRDSIGEVTGRGERAAKEKVYEFYVEEY
jgi:hypothetical protein